MLVFLWCGVIQTLNRKWYICGQPEQEQREEVYENYSDFPKENYQTLPLQRWPSIVVKCSITLSNINISLVCTYLVQT